MTTIDEETGEILDAEHTQLTTVDQNALSVIHRVEIDARIATAKQYPRSLTRTRADIMTLATLDEDTAESCCYALVRGGKSAIEGPSIRLAEIAAQSFGNCISDARLVAVNRQEMYVEAEGMFHDLEKNAATRATVRRRISNKTGKVFSEDMIIVTGNAACAIAKRNAILAGVPRGLYQAAYKAAREIIAGTVQTMEQNRLKVFKAFAAYGVAPQQIYDKLAIAGEDDVKVEQIALLRAIFASIKNGEHTVDDVFGRPAPAHETVKDALSNEPSAAEVKREPAAAPAAAPTEDAPAAAAADPGAAQEAKEEAKEEAEAEAPMTLLDAARLRAMEGRQAFDSFYNRLKPHQLDELKPAMSALMKAAKAADAQAKKEGDQ